MTRNQWLALAICVGIALPRVSAQSLDKAVLDSTVWISYQVEASPAGSNQLHSPGTAAAKATPAAVFGGTGFLLFHAMGITKGQVFLVTNRHVLPPEGKQQDIKVRVVVRDRDGAARLEAVSVPVVGSDGKYLRTVRLHPDPDTDVAAINIAPAAFGSRFQLLIDAVTTGKYLDTAMLMSSERIRAAGLGMGTPVYVIGFPAALFDPRNVSPILRLGLIATDPAEGFTFNDDLRRVQQYPEHVDGFLIDANIYPGSSGSLVVLAPESMAKGERDPKSPEWRPAILGIVAGSIPMFDASLRAYERIGLGIVYSADTIQEVINSFSR